MNEKGIGPRYFKQVFKYEDGEVHLRIAAIPYCCGAVQAVGFYSKEDFLHMPLESDGWSSDYVYSEDVMKRRIEVYNDVYKFLVYGIYELYEISDIQRAVLESGYTEEEALELVWESERGAVVLLDAVGGERGVQYPSIYEMLHGRPGVLESEPVINENSGNIIVTFTIPTESGKYTDEYKEVNRIDWSNGGELIPQEDW